MTRVPRWPGSVSLSQSLLSRSSRSRATRSRRSTWPAAFGRPRSGAGQKGPVVKPTLGSGLPSAAIPRWLDQQGRRTGWRARQRRFRRSIPRPIGREWLPWAFAIVVLGVVTAWQAAQASPQTAGAAVVLTLGATVAAIVTHALGHLVAVRALRGRLLPASWGPGAIVALAILPFQAASGPFPAERIRLPRGGSRGLWAFHLAGPAANALLGLAAYLLFIAEPIPALRLLSQVQLAAIGYALLPTRPLDGWVLKRERPRLLAALGLRRRRGPSGQHRLPGDGRRHVGPADLALRDHHAEGRGSPARPAGCASYPRLRTAAA